MELERETVRRIAACFRGQTCCRCNRPAERLVHRRYFCGEHYLCTWSPQRQPGPKVFKLWPDRK